MSTDDIGVLLSRTCPPHGIVRDSTTARLSLRVDALSNLAFILAAIEVAARLGDEAVRANPPFLEAADLNSLPGSAGPGIAADQRPAVHGILVVDDKIIQNHLQVWKGRHEFSGRLGNGTAPHRRISFVDA